MNDYKDKYNDINTLCSAKGIPVEWLMYELLSKYSINELKQRI